MSEKNKILNEALKMSPVERVEIVDQLLQSLDKPDEKIDVLWKKEVENRIDAYEAGNAKTVSVQEMLEKYKDI
ncbi:MAG: addiction module protein [Balneolaceae bacterium]|nr:addiction module protein [Balneolaceae bacterium]